MDNFTASRRDFLKGTTVGLLGLGGLSVGSVPVAAHEKIDTPATDLLGPIQVPANSDAGFNYPYYLYLPETTQTEPVPMLVAPNNTGSPSDELGEHRAAVERRLADGLGPQLYSKALIVPLLVPVFPRPAGEIAPRGTYTHALDEDSIELEGTDVERVDRQLVGMIEHAQGLLDDLSYPVADDIMMNGFSAAGNFVNRFAALHPEKVRSLTGGGINGTPILPLERAKGHRLDYPIGIADIEAITGEPFDATEWRDVSQFLYLGGEDNNDTIPYDDAWSDRHQRVAVDVYGEDMQAERMSYSETVYDDAGADATFKIYEGVGHTPVPLQIQEDIARFHRTNAGLKQIAFAEQPEIGDTTVTFETFVFDEREYHLRVRSAERGDITETPASVTTNEEGTETVTLSSAVEKEEIVGVAVPRSTTDPDSAVASAGAVVKELPLLRIVDPPTAARPSVTFEYGVSSDYQTSSQIHVFVRDSDGGEVLLTTFETGVTDEKTYGLTGEDSTLAVENGTELSVSLKDVDDGSTLASTSITVGEGGGNEETTTETESVAFSTQPTDAQDSLDIAYSVEDGDEPTKALTLQGEVGEDTDLLLGVPTVGEERTETFSVEQIPMTAGDDILVKTVDEQVLATDRTVVLRDTDGGVTVQYTDLPTDEDQSATVEYSVSGSYEPADALTLRVYDGTLYGTDPSGAVALLSPGDTGTETFTIGEDTDADIDDPVVAIVDDVPLALASVDDLVAEQERSGETDEEPTDEQEGSEETDEQQQTDEAERSDEDPAETEDGRDGETTAADGPGFGVGSALAGLGGLSYALKDRLDEPSSEQSRSDETE